MPLGEREYDYAAQICKGVGAQAKPFRMALGELTRRARLGFRDEEPLFLNIENTIKAQSTP